ncbi:Os11g0689650, partial [Oryza sativa Japonica Group]
CFFWCIQHSRTRELSAHHAKQVLEDQDWNSQQKAKSITELDELIRHSPEQSQKTNDAPLEEDNLHLRQKDGSHGTTTYCIASESFNAPLPANRVNHITDSISFIPASNTTGISKDPVIHKVISPAKNTEINMMETAPKSTSQSQGNSAPKHWKIDNRQRHVESWERITIERSNIAENAEYAKNIAETPTDAPSAEAQCHEDLSTVDKNSWRDASAATTASQPVFDKKNATKVPSAHKTLSGVVISNSMIPVTSVSGLTVGSIMLGDISFISVNQVGATAARVIHDTKNTHSRTTTIQQPSKKEQPEEGALNNMAVAAPTLLSGNHSIVQDTAMIAEWSEMEKHKSVEKEQLNQWNLGKMLPAQSHRASYGNPGTFNFGAESRANKALYNFTADKVEPTTKLDKWLDRESSWVQVKTGQQYTDGSASLMQHLTEQVDKIDQWQSPEPDKQVKRQFEFKTHDGSDSRLEPVRTVPLPVNNWEMRHASYSQKQNHVEGQRNVRTSDATNIYEGRDRTRAFYEPMGSEMVLYSDQIEGNVIWEDGHPLIWNPTDWEYQTLNPEPHHLDHGQHRGSETDLYSDQVEGDVIWEDGCTLIWNPTDWEYQPLNPAPHHHDQHSGRYHRGGDTYSEWGYDAGEPTYGANEGRRKGGIHSEYQSKPVGSSDVAPDIQRNAGADDQSRRHPASGAAYRERRYYI